MSDQEKIEESYKYLVDGDTEAGLKILEELHLAGNARSTLILGTIYYMGSYGIKTDYSKALPYLEKSSKEYNDPLAQGSLSTMYFEGDGVEQNYMDAYLWAHKSVENGGGENSLKLLENIEKNFSLENIEKMKEYVRMNDELKAKEKELDNFFDWDKLKNKE